MSAYSETQTTFTDADLLCEALKEMGFSIVRHHLTGPQHLRDWHGKKRPDMADIVIPREVIGSASNDIGFRRNASGKFEAIISEYDERIGYNTAWMGRLKTAYAEKGIMRQAQRAGLRFVGRKVVKGKIEFDFIKA